MGGWNILDKSEHAIEYQPTVYFDKLNSNFSIIVNAVLQSDVHCEFLDVKSTIRLPYVCLYFDNTILVTTASKCEVKLFKAFEVKIKLVLIRRRCDNLVVVLENGNLFDINLNTGAQLLSNAGMQEKFSPDLMIEQDDDSIVVVNNDILNPYYLITISKKMNANGELKMAVLPIKYDRINSKTIFDIELHQNKRLKVEKLSLCVKLSPNKNINMVCPVTNQNYVIGESLQAVNIKPFENSTKLLLMLNSETDKYNLGIADVQNMDLQFNIPVSKNCTLIGGINDVALYIDIKDGKMYIYMIQENSPMSQLEILISLRKYEEAEQFAKTHNLSPTAVLELKAKFLLGNLKKNFSPESQQELLDILSSCENIEFIVNCCCEGIEANIQLLKLLEFAKMKLLNTDNVDLNKKVDKLSWKVEAFKLLRIEEDFPFEWREFVYENPISLCKKFIVNDQLDYAAIVWIKSYRSIASTLKLENVADLLCSISLDTKLNTLLRWLEYFIPNIMCIMPHSADLIVTWAKDRICILENSVHWPEVGIQFAEKFSNLMFNSKRMIAFVPPSAEKVYHLINCMTQIQILKKKYNIVISLRDFTTLSSSELVKLILRKAFVEDLKSVLNDFLDNFIVKHGLNHDILIREYIEELIASSSMDEAKIEILINCIYNADEKYQCVLLVLKSAPVPWSVNIKNISSDAIASKHILVPQIQIEILHADIRSILMKYKCMDMAPEDYGCLIQLIIRKGDSQMMSDIEKITSIYSSFKEDAYLSCMRKYISCNEVQKALDIYNKMGDGIKKTYIDAFIMILEDQLNSSEIDQQLEFNFLDFFRSCNIEKKSISYLNCIYILKNRYKLFISYNEYCIEEYRKYFYSNWCKDKMEYMNRSSENVKEILLQCIKVGKHLKISKVNSILILCNQSNSKILQTLADSIMSETSYFIENDIKVIDLVLKLSSMINFSNILVLDNSLNCMFHILEDCDSRHMPYCLEVCSWLTSIYFAHNNTRENLSLWKIPSFYNPHVISSIIPVWREIFSRNQSSNYISKEISVCLCKIDEQCLDGSVCLQTLLSKYQGQQNDIHFVRIMAYCVNWHLKKDLTIPHWLKELNDSMVKVLISKAIMFEKPDNLLVSMLLFSYSSPSEWLNDALNNYAHTNRKINIAQHILKCREVYHHINVPYAQAFVINSQNNMEIKLENYGILLKNNQEDDTYSLATLLETLVNTKMCSIEVLEEFCKVAKMNLNKTLTYYLFSMLKSWHNDYKFTNDNFGKCQITVCDNNKKHDTIQSCFNVINKITSKSELIEDLTKLFQNGEVEFANLSTISLSPYCYEAYLFIIDLLKYITGSQLFLREFLILKFLQTYQRVGKPKQSEMEESSMKGNFPKIGFYRLPFQIVISDNSWDNLKPEVTLATYKQWLPIAGLLQLDVDVQASRDMICSNAVKRTMTNEKHSNEGSNMKWTLHLKNDRLLKEAHECVQNISNLEWAGACFYYVFQGSAYGADQVAAVDMCYKFAEHWAKIEPNHNVVKKMQMKHLFTSSVHVLHKIGLAEEKLLALCDNPHRLIEALYNHETIITRYECSNINNAVDEIAEKHNLNAGAVRMSILERILNVNVNPSDTSVSNHNKTMSGNDGTLNRENLMRACYILKGTNQMMAALYLSRMGLGNIESIENYNINIKALQCLLSLADGDVIEKVTNHRVSDLWFKLWEFYFINGLNLIGLEYLISMFYEDKSQVIQLIWHARDHNHLTISLIVKMITIYNIQIGDVLLDNIVKALLKFDLMFEVRNFLYSIRSIYGPNYIEMWSHVLLDPFKRLLHSSSSVPVIGQQKDECYEALRLLPVCPVLSHIDLSPIWYNCLRYGIIEMAVIVLPHLLRDDRKPIMAKIGKIKKSTLQELKVIKSKGILTTNMALTILKHELGK